MTAAEGHAGSVMRPVRGGPFRQRGRAGATNRKLANWLLAAGVAAFAVSIAGFTLAASALLIPKAAREFWAGRMFLRVGRVGNAAYVGNQSLYGASIRLLGSAREAHPYYLAAATVIGLAGLLVAASLSRRGQELAGVVTCALTGLLVSPVSWSHHWVWIAPTLVLLTDLAVRAGKAARLAAGRVADRLALAAAALAVMAVLALYVAYPFHAAPGAPWLPAGVIWTLPPRALQGSGLSGYQELVGNLYVVASLVGLIAIGAWLGERQVRVSSSSRARSSSSVSPARRASR